MTSIVVALVSFAAALCLGWVLSKAYFITQTAGNLIPRKEHEKMRKRYRKRLLIMHKVIRRHEATQEQIKEMLTDIQKEHRTRKNAAGNTETADAGDTHGELSGLLSRISARDREIADLQSQLESEPKSATEKAATESDAQEQTADLRAELGAVRAELSSRERQAQELQRQLDDSETERQELRAKLDSWKQRVSPLTKKLKQQRAAIRELKDNVGEPA